MNIEDFRTLLNTFEHFLALLVFVGGLVSFIFRNYITNWIKSKFESEVGKQLASHKHNLDRELEAYKMSLVRDLEQLKANIDIRRSIALQVASTQLVAITALFADLNTFLNAATAYTVYPLPVRQHAGEDFGKKTNAMRDSFRAAEIYLGVELRARISTVTAEAHSLAIEFSEKEDLLEKSDARIQKILTENIAINDLLRNEIQDLTL